ncbi:hypothetical protein PENTCL1PPCAC_803, partial [Pristionchus entomophagus]
AAAAGLKNAVGVFKQVNKFGEPIYKHISGGKAGWRQVNDAGKGAIFKPTAYNGWLSGLGTACVVVSVAVDAIEIGTAIKKDHENGTKHNTVHAAVGVAGSWALVIPCARYGASLGSRVSDEGALVGAILG